MDSYIIYRKKFLKEKLFIRGEGVKLAGGGA